MKNTEKAVQTIWKVYDSPILENVIAEFKTKGELLAYGEKNDVRADCVALFNKQNPHGYVFLGWDEIE